MTRLVRGADGRMWSVRYHMEWVNPVTADDFEHDVSAARGSGVFMAVLVGTFVAVLVAWKESQGMVVVPGWLLLALALVLLFFPVRWVLRRPWTVVAETPGDLDDHPPERWVGTVRGVVAVRTTAARIAHEIQEYSSPGLDGALQPVD
jgi:hypothetical protein